MRHQDKTSKKFDRKPSHRNAMLMNIVSSLIEHESIKTTEAKAKAAAPILEKLITMAKKGDAASKKNIEAYLPTRSLSDKLFTVLSSRYADKKSGFVSKVRLAKRVGDNSRMILLSLIKEESKNK